MLHNLTPHAVVIVTPEGELVLPPASAAARVHLSRVHVMDLLVGQHRVPVYRPRVDGVRGVPAETPPCAQDCRLQGWGGLCDHRPLYIVSRLVAEALPYREDLLVPDPVRMRADGTTAAHGLARVAELCYESLPFGYRTMSSKR